MPKPSATLRALLLKSIESRYAIAKATGIDQATLSRFVRGKYGLNLQAVDALAAHFDIEFQPVRKSRSSKG